MRFHMLQNVQMALDFLRYKKIKLVNIRAEDIVDGNPKLTLGLIWTIILHFQVSEYPASAALPPTIIVDYDAFTNDTPSSPITDKKYLDTWFALSSHVSSQGRTTIPFNMRSNNISRFAFEQLRYRPREISLSFEKPYRVRAG